MREIKEWYWDEQEIEYVIRELEKICRIIEYCRYDDTIEWLEKRIEDDKYDDMAFDKESCYILNECIIALSMFKIGCYGNDIIKKIKSDIEWFYHMLYCINIYGYVR